MWISAKLVILDLKETWANTFSLLLQSLGRSHQLQSRNISPRVPSHQALSWAADEQCFHPKIWCSWNNHPHTNLTWWRLAPFLCLRKLGHPLWIVSSKLTRWNGHKCHKCGEQNCPPKDMINRCGQEVNSSSNSIPYLGKEILHKIYPQHKSTNKKKAS